MTTDDKYFMWLCSKIQPEENEEKPSYIFLLKALFDTPYTVMPGYTVDEIRLEKTAELHTEFDKYEGNMSSYNRPFISCLEVIISLADCAEQHVMRDRTFGDRTSVWFWIMISNLGLLAYDDEHYNEYAVLKILKRFVERKYTRDGRGSIAYTTKHTKDFRKLDVWQQLNMYLSENYITKESQIHGSII